MLGVGRGTPSAHRRGQPKKSCYSCRATAWVPFAIPMDFSIPRLALPISIAVACTVDEGYSFERGSPSGDGGQGVVDSKPPSPHFGTGGAAGSETTGGSQENSGGDEGAETPSEGGHPSATPSGCGADGRLRCRDNQRERCEDGEWAVLSDQLQCGGNTPVCSNGLCATYRLGFAALVVLPSSPAGTDSDYALFHQSFGHVTTRCDKRYCVAGGIHP
jgi:hypothetical protein